MNRLLVSSLLLLGALGCSGPRFQQHVTTRFAHQDVRKLETPELDVYYVASQKQNAYRLVAKLERCLKPLRAHARSRSRRARPVIYLTPAVLNNANVQPAAFGLSEHMVLGTSVNAEQIMLLGVPLTHMEAIACHEAVHYVHLQQTDGPWSAIDLVTGNVWSPNAVLDAWFSEGLATWYEATFAEGQGRLNSPMWRGWYHSFLQQRGGRIGAGDLLGARDVPNGPYLAGSYFIDFLARKYGEEKLWELIDLQGHSIISLLGVTLRFSKVYGKTIDGLLEEYNQELAGTFHPRTRPAEQRVLEASLGSEARLAVSPADGAVALIRSGLDATATLRIQERSGAIRFERTLKPLLPGRRWVAAGPTATSGMSFTADGRWLFFVSADYSELGDFIARLWKVDARTGEVVRLWDGIEGVGGAIHPDGSSYVYVEVKGDTANLVKLELETGTRTSLTNFTGTESLAAPACSPTGDRISFSRWTGRGFDLFVRGPDGAIEQLTFDGRFNLGSRWMDGRRLVFLREHEKLAQVHLLDLEDRHVQRLSDVPWIAMDPSPLDGSRVLLLNREGLSWSLDELALPSPTSSAPPPAASDPGSLELSKVLGASGALPNDTPPEVEVLSDEPYAPLDGLLRPTMHLPLLGLWNTQAPNGSVRWNRLVGMARLQGADRLGFHNYLAWFSFDSENMRTNLSLSYGNYQLAPWYLDVSGSRSTDGALLDWTASISASRSWWNSIDLRFAGELLDRTLGATEHSSSRHVRLAGPRLSAGYSVVDSTAYVNRRGLVLSLSGAAFPSQVSTEGLFDLRGAMTVFLPLPVLRRDELELKVTARAMPGSSQELLQLGGFSQGMSLYNIGAAPPREPRDTFLPPGATFQEPLRGYEDFSLFVNHAAVGGVRYRVPLIIDRGWSSLAYLLPSVHVRELDLEGFAQAALAADNTGRHWHRVAGGAAFFRLNVGGYLPLSLYYQFAHRFDDGLKPLHTFGLSFD
ncbi:TolB family protein [Cystobacter fuscus]|uniref:TolB family protein n=1 Tax=Cystobacter fuscus TaxID=43 RepID=UPI0037C0D08A